MRARLMVMVVTFWNTLSMMEMNTFHLRSRTLAADKWQGYVPGNYRFYWSQVWDFLRAGKDAALCGPFSTKRWSSTNGERRLHRHLFLNNAFLVYLILVSRSSTSFGIVSKLGGFGVGPPTSCMNFVGSGLAITTPSVGLKLYSEKEFLSGMGRWSKFGTSWEVLPFALLGLNVTTKFSTTNNGMK